MAVSETSALLCPKCHAQQCEGASECAKCGIIFAKYRPFVTPKRASQAPSSLMESVWVLAARQWLIETDTTTDRATFYGRAGILLVLVWWGWKFMMTPLETNYTGVSFL